MWSMPKHHLLCEFLLPYHLIIAYPENKVKCLRHLQNRRFSAIYDPPLFLNILVRKHTPWRDTITQKSRLELEREPHGPDAKTPLPTTPTPPTSKIKTFFQFVNP